MRANELIGKKVTRYAPCECNYGKDFSYMGDIMYIVNATDYLITVLPIDNGSLNKTFNLSAEWCDDNWVDVEEYLKIADNNLVVLAKTLHLPNNTRSINVE